jgi:hypothetical protein
MKTILLLLTFSILINIQANAQRDRQGNGRGQESGRIVRIERIQDSNTRNNTNQKTVKRHQIVSQKPIPIQPVVKVYNETHQPGYCIVKKPGKYNFPDRIYSIPNIEPVLEYLMREDFDSAIELLNHLIHENHMGPELYFLRGFAYMKRKSEFKMEDYFKAKSDFILLKGWDPNFPQLSRYLQLLDYYLYGKRPIINTTR